MPTPEGGAGARPTRASRVALREITAETLGGVLALRVRDDQRAFVADNAVSVAQAHFDDGAWLRAIDAAGTPVGFVLLHEENLRAEPEEPDYHYLWRFMIDQRFQGLGFGRRAMELVVAHVRENPRARQLFLHHRPGAPGPGGFYRKLGFVPTGREEGGEVELRLDL